MDYTFTLFISGLLSIILMYIALGVFIKRFRAIADQLTRETRLALMFFASSAVAVTFNFILSYLYLGLVLTFVVWEITFLLLGEFSLVISEPSKIRLAIGIVVFGSLAATVESVLSNLIGPFPTILTYMILGIGSIATLFLSLYLLVVSPNAFTGSLFTTFAFYMFAAFLGETGTISIHPEYYFVKILVYIMMAAIMFSLLRPWRYIVVSFIGIFAMINGISLVLTAYLSGETQILIFTAMAGLAALSTTIPLNFFIKQYTDTHAVVPIYVTLTIVTVALLIITHSINYSIANSIGYWDENIEYVDGFIGIVSVISFFMAAFSTIASTTARRTMREILIALGFAMATIIHPYIRAGRYELSVIYPILIILIILTFLQYFQITRKLARMGSARAGLQFILFMFALLFLGLVAMFADVIPFPILIVLFVGATIGQLIGTPRIMPRKKG